LGSGRKLHVLVCTNDCEHEPPSEREWPPRGIAHDLGCEKLIFLPASFEFAAACRDYQHLRQPVRQRAIGLNEEVAHLALPAFIYLPLRHACSRPLEIFGLHTSDETILAQKQGMIALTRHHKGTGSTENEDVISSIILGTSLLTGRGIPVAGEYEIKNAQAMKIMDSFGAGGSFSEFYAVDYNDDVVLMGHDGP
jgi:hypothetical protein